MATINLKKKAVKYKAILFDGTNQNQIEAFCKGDMVQRGTGYEVQSSTGTFLITAGMYVITSKAQDMFAPSTADFINDFFDTDNS